MVARNSLSIMYVNFEASHVALSQHLLLIFFVYFSYTVGCESSIRITERSNSGGTTSWKPAECVGCGGGERSDERRVDVGSDGAG